MRGIGERCLVYRGVILLKLVLLQRLQADAKRVADDRIHLVQELSRLTRLDGPKMYRVEEDVRILGRQVVGEVASIEQSN